MFHCTECDYPICALEIVVEILGYANSISGIKYRSRLEKIYYVCFSADDILQNIVVIQRIFYEAILKLHCYEIDCFNTLGAKIVHSSDSKIQI